MSQVCAELHFSFLIMTRADRCPNPSQPRSACVNYVQGEMQMYICCLLPWPLGTVLLSRVVAVRALLAQVLALAMDVAVSDSMMPYSQPDVVAHVLQKSLLIWNA